MNQKTKKGNLGTPPLTWFFGPRKNRVKGKPRYRRSILVLKPQNGEYESSKSSFLWEMGLLNFQSPLFEQSFATQQISNWIFDGKKSLSKKNLAKKFLLQKKN